jgi:hypothetical protein
VLGSLAGGWCLAIPGQFLSLAAPATLIATVTAEAIPNRALHATVTAVSPELRPQSIAAATSEHAAEVRPIVLNLQNNGGMLPIGMPVTLQFNSCPTRS